MFYFYPYCTIFLFIIQRKIDLEKFSITPPYPWWFLESQNCHELQHFYIQVVPFSSITGHFLVARLVKVRFRSSRRRNKSVIERQANRQAWHSRLTRGDFSVVASTNQTKRTGGRYPTGDPSPYKRLQPSFACLRGYIYIYIRVVSYPESNNRVQKLVCGTLPGAPKL